MKEKADGRNNLAESTKNRGILRAVLTALFWLALWEVISLAVNMPLLMPGPLDTAKALIRLFGSESFYLDVLSTLLRCVFGVMISFVLGYYLALLAHKHKMLREFLKGPVRFFKAIPVMAIIIYLILLVSSDKVAVIVCLFMCFPIAYTNILGGLDNTAKEYAELAIVFELTDRETDRYIKRPAIQPYAVQALNLMCGMSFKVVIASEVLSIPTHSLGYEMLNAKYYLDTPSLFAYMCVIILLAFMFERVVSVLLRRYTWRTYEGAKMSGIQKKTRCGITEIKELVESDDENVVKVAKPGFKESTHADENNGMVILSGICKTYTGSEEPVLSNFELRLKKGKVTALMGPSGIGKTTIARIITGLESADEGLVNTTNTTISYMFQEDRLLPWFNVYDNMAISGINDGDKIAAMAEALELKDDLYKLPAELSGGMKQRVALGRTLLKDADMMILDEPFKGFDEALRQRIIGRLWNIIRTDKTVLLITHDSDDADKLADEILHI